jgi:transglutaminase-like putative cysteine protease
MNQRGDSASTGEPALGKPRSRLISTFSIASEQDRKFKFCLASLVGLSIGAACIENGLHPLLLLAVPVAVVATVRADYQRPVLWSEKVITALFLVYLATFCVWGLVLTARVSAPVFLVYFTFGTVMVRVLSPLTDRNISQLIFLTVGLVLLNCILTNHILFAVILLLYLFFLMATLLFFHLARTRATSGKMMQPLLTGEHSGTWQGRLSTYYFFILALTVVLFLVLPRPFAMLPGLRAAMSRGGGFSDLGQGITYRDMTSMAGLNRIAFVATFHRGTPPEPLYWRGRVLAKTNGRGWYSAPKRRRMGHFIRPTESETFVYRILPYRLHSDLVYVCGLPLRVTDQRRRPLLINSSGEVVIDTPFLVSDVYKIVAVKRPIPASHHFEPVYLESKMIPPKIRELALEWTKGARTPREKAEALLARFGRGFTYRLRAPSAPAGVNPLEHFLFATRRGNCEYFAGAMALMLRTVGVPSRVVEGFLGAEKARGPKEFTVRFSNAHAWVEAVLDGSDWTPLDPTPPAATPTSHTLWRFLTDLYDRTEYQWVRTVVNFDRSDQLMLRQTLSRLFTTGVSLPLGILSKSRPYLLASLAVALFVAIALVLARRHRLKNGELSAIYLKTMRDMVRKRLLDRVHPWHEQNLNEIIQKAPDARNAVSRFVNTYLEGRFGERGRISREDLLKARQDLLEEIGRVAGRGIGSATKL